MAAKPKSAALSIEVIRLPHGRDLPMPAYQTKGAAGMDLHAAVPEGTPLTLDPCDRALVPTGLVMQLPTGFEAQVRPRSGLAFKNGVTVLNSPGTIDSDYRGEVQVLMINLGREPFEITRGMRIAQLVVASVSRVAIVEGKALAGTRRGAGGFGSTGVVTVKKSKRVPVAKKSRNARPG